MFTLPYIYPERRAISTLCFVEPSRVLTLTGRTQKRPLKKGPFIVWRWDRDSNPS